MNEKNVYTEQLSCLSEFETKNVIEHLKLRELKNNNKDPILELNVTVTKCPSVNPSLELIYSFPCFPISIMLISHLLH